MYKGTRTQPREMIKYKVYLCTFLHIYKSCSSWEAVAKRRSRGTGPGGRTQDSSDAAAEPTATKLREEAEARARTGFSGKDAALAAMIAW